MDRKVAVIDESLTSDAVDDHAGFGALETSRGRLPLTGLAVTTRIVGLIAETRVRQTFRNALDESLEATYIFPLPDRAAVTSFRLLVAGRTVEGELKERGQAREEYDAAIQQGHRAAIAEEERSGVFHLRVGNLPPHEEAVVELTFVGPVPVADGEATFRFPLVVAPRYTPGIPLDGPSVGAGTTPDTDQVPDASRVTPPVLLPGFPNPVSLSLEVTLDPASVAAGDTQWSQQIRSSLHSVVTADGPHWTVSLQPGERLNRDFVLRFPAARETLASSMHCHAASDEQPGTFALTLFPPAGQGVQQPMPRRVVFVLDRSGSMGGWKMVAARRAVGRMIDTLLDQDQFTVVAFDSTVEQPPHVTGGFAAGTDRQRWKMLQWLGKVDSRGGTEMGPALQTALGMFPNDAHSFRSILVLITDGQVTGEDAILRSLAQFDGQSLPRIFTVGIDRAVNVGFLRRLADFGRGDSELVESEDRLDEAMDRIHRRIGTPLLTQVQVEPIDGQWVEDSLAPRRLPDLYVDRPLTIFGRHRTTDNSVRVRVKAVDATGRPWQQDITACAAPADLLTSMWGRAKVRDLEDEYAAGQRGDRQALMDRIVQVSLESHVLSRFTAYVAVDKSDITNPGGRPLEVIQPVESPEGWAMGGMAGSVDGLLCASISHEPQRSVRASRSTQYFMSPRSAPLMRGEVEEMRSTLGEPHSIASPSDFADANKHFFSQLLSKSAEDPVRVLEMLLAEAIRTGASQISVDLRGRRIRFQYLLGGKWIECAMLPQGGWQPLLEAIKRRAGIDEAPPSWPQQGEIQYRGSAFPVTITQSKKREKVSIQIPTDAAGAEDRQDATDESAEKRTRFWT